MAHCTGSTPTEPPVISWLKFVKVRLEGGFDPPNSRDSVRVDLGQLQKQACDHCPGEVIIIHRPRDGSKSREMIFSFDAGILPERRIENLL